MSKKAKLETVDNVIIRFAGDSGDGMQLSGGRFTQTAAIMGNDLSTLPDFPAEIRAPAGSLPGVSSFQIHFSSKEIHTRHQCVHRNDTILNLIQWYPKHIPIKVLR